MYYKEIETDKVAKKQHDDNLKKNAAARLRLNATKKMFFKKRSLPDA